MNQADAKSQGMMCLNIFIIVSPKHTFLSTRRRNLSFAMGISRMLSRCCAHAALEKHFDLMLGETQGNSTQTLPCFVFFSEFFVNQTKFIACQLAVTILSGARRSSVEARGELHPEVAPRSDRVKNSREIIKFKYSLPLLDLLTAAWPSFFYQPAINNKNCKLPDKNLPQRRWLLLIVGCDNFLCLLASSVTTCSLLCFFACLNINLLPPPLSLALFSSTLQP